MMFETVAKYHNIFSEPSKPGGHYQICKTCLGCRDLSFVNQRPPWSIPLYAPMAQSPPFLAFMLDIETFCGAGDAPTAQDIANYMEALQGEYYTYPNATCTTYHQMRVYA